MFKPGYYYEMSMFPNGFLQEHIPCLSNLFISTSHVHRIAVPSLPADQFWFASGKPDSGPVRTLRRTGPHQTHQALCPKLRHAQCVAVYRAISLQEPLCSSAQNGNDSWIRKYVTVFSAFEAKSMKTDSEIIKGRLNAHATFDSKDPTYCKSPNRRNNTNVIFTLLLQYMKSIHRAGASGNVVGWGTML
jgi:hypothetical protein